MKNLHIRLESNMLWPMLKEHGVVKVEILHTLFILTYVSSPTLTIIALNPCNGLQILSKEYKANNEQTVVDRLYDFINEVNSGEIKPVESVTN